jgi:uncharacterized membrane protein
MTDNQTPSGRTPQSQSANTPPEESGSAREAQSSPQQTTPDKELGEEQQPPLAPRPAAQAEPSPQPQPQPVTFSLPPSVLAQLFASAQRQALPYAAGLVQTQMQVWQSQYPPPDAAERFERILPGSFNRILGMAERLQEGQIEATERGQTYAMRDTRRAHWLGWSIAVLAMFGAVGCMLLNYPWGLAAVFLSVPVMGVAKALIETATSKLQSPQLQAPTPPTPPPSPPKK